MIGTPAGVAAFAASWIAEICGTPTPATMRVVQIEPGPTPTLMPSAPASTSAWAPSRVATLPPTMSISVLRLSRRTISITAWEWPWAVSTTRKSTPASIKACARFSASSPTPIAAPTTRRPLASFVAQGYLSALTKSLMVNRPCNRPCSSTRGSFSTFFVESNASAASGSISTVPVTSGMGVMTSRTLRLRSSSKRISRFVTMPSKTPLSSTTGTPEIRYFAQRLSTSARE